MPATVYEFHRFELDLGRYELRRAGRRIRLQRVPMDLLILLVERRGALVTREDIVAGVWTSDSIVDTERSINTAIRKIRQALDDDAGTPRFIETVVGKGYRFIAEVTEISATPSALSAPESPPEISVEKEETLRPATQRRPGRALTWASVAVAVVALGGVVAAITTASLRRTTESMKVSPFTALPGSESGPAFSPDGKHVAFSWLSEEGSRQHLYVKTVATGSTVRLTATGNRDSDPAWSPDGGSIAFLRQDVRHGMSLYVISASGGAERKVYAFSRSSSFRPAWSPDASRMAIVDSESPDAPASIFLITLHSGQKRRLTTPVPTTTGDWAPAFSPDGRSLAYVHNTGSSRSSQLYSLPVDRSGIPVGQPRQFQTGHVACTSLDWSADGRFLICATREGLMRIPASGGRAEQLPFRDASQSSISLQGNRLVYVQSVRDTDVFRAPGAGEPGAITKLISSTRMDGAPQYSPDGERVAFISERGGAEQLWVADSQGQHAAQLTSMAGAGAGSPRWSPDGRLIAFDSNQDELANIYIIDAAGGRPRRITEGRWNNVRPSWSRDGKWIYFGSDRTGAWEIWKTPVESGTPVRVTNNGAREAFEDSEGKFLYFTKAKPTRGIWRLRLSDASEQLVTDEGFQARWAIGKRGVYYLTATGGLELREVSSGRRVPIPTIGLEPGTGAGGGLLGLGPGDRWILVTGLVRSDSDLTIVENFHF